MNAPPCSIGSKHLNGISKLVEEMGELHTVLGKAMAVGCFGQHWSHDDLREWAAQEMGDVIAAINFVANENGINRLAIAERAREKQALFELWNVERGLPAKDTPCPACNGTGHRREDAKCRVCGGSGKGCVSEKES